MFPGQHAPDQCIQLIVARGRHRAGQIRRGKVAVKHGHHLSGGRFGLRRKGVLLQHGLQPPAQAATDQDRDQERDEGKTRQQA